MRGHWALNPCSVVLEELAGNAGEFRGKQFGSCGCLGCTISMLQHGVKTEKCCSTLYAAIACWLFRSRETGGDGNFFFHFWGVLQFGAAIWTSPVTSIAPTLNQAHDNLSLAIAYFGQPLESFPSPVYFYQHFVQWSPTCLIFPSREEARCVLSPFFSWTPNSSFIPPVIQQDRESPCWLGITPNVVMIGVPTQCLNELVMTTWIIKTRGANITIFFLETQKNIYIHATHPSIWIHAPNLIPISTYELTDLEIDEVTICTPHRRVRRLLLKE